MRAKPKAFNPLSWSPRQPLILRAKDGELLLEDLDLDVRRDKAACRKMLDALSRSIESYRAWAAFNTELPTMASQLAELRALAPILEAASRALCEFSPLARQRLKNTLVTGVLAGRSAQADGSRLPDAVTDHFEKVTRTIDGIDRAANDLCDVSIAIQYAIATLSTKERRGRTADTVHALVKELSAIFTKYDRGEHDDDVARNSARDAFIRHALKSAHINTPKRLAFPLRNK